MTRIVMLCCLLSTLGCGDDTTSTTALDMAAAGTTVQRTADLPVNFQLQGLWWDSSTMALYAANNAGQIVRFDDDTMKFSVVANMPLITSGPSGLGQLVKLKDGSWLVTRFGMGTNGSLIKVATDGSVSTVPNLDPTRRRVGLTVAPDGTIYDGWFFASNMVPSMGTISKVDLTAGSETDVVTGIGKPVGVLAMGDQLYVSDQLNNVILKTPLATPGTTSTFSSVSGTDELAAGPSSTLFAVTDSGSVYQVASDGTATEIKSGYKPLRGVAYDGDHKRLFVGEPDAGGGDAGAGMPMLHILPID